MHKYYQAITLLELLLTLAIISITLTVTIPGIAYLYQRHQVQHDSWQLLHVLRYARHQAMIHGKFITVCPCNDDLHCIKSWGKHLLVFQDNNRDGQHQPSELALQTVSLFANTAVLTYRGLSNQHHIMFDGLGSTINNGRLSYEVDQRQLQFVISATGRVRLISNGSQIIL